MSLVWILLGLGFAAALYGLVCLPVWLEAEQRACAPRVPPPERDQEATHATK